MTHIPHTDFSGQGFSGSAVAGAARLAGAGLAGALWLFSAFGRRFPATLQVVSRSFAMAYVDPFAPSNATPAPGRPVRSVRK